MKILLISPFTSVSGSAIRFWNIAQHLSNNGFDVVYVERRPRGAPMPAFTSDIIYLGTPKFANLFLDIFISFLYNLFILFKHKNASVFYALKPAPNNAIPALLAKKMGMKIILDIDDLDYGYFNNGVKRNISKYFFNTLPKHFDLITCHTEKLRSYIIKRISIPEKKIYFLAQGLSDAFVNFSPQSKPVNIPDSIVYCATLGITSDLSDLFPMFVRLIDDNPNLKINIIGDGVKRSILENKIKALGLSKNISFLGRVPHDNLPQIMAKNTIGINYMRPSITNESRAILKIREYLSVGLNVVCNDVGDGNVFSDYVRLATTIDGMEIEIRKLLKSSKKVNWDGRDFLIKNFQWSIIIKQFLKELKNKKLLPSQ